MVATAKALTPALSRVREREQDGAPDTPNMPNVQDMQDVPDLRAVLDLCNTSGLPSTSDVAGALGWHDTSGRVGSLAGHTGVGRETSASLPSPLSRTREWVRVRARALRTTPTDAEAPLWYHLRDRHLAGHKFRRQHPIGPYFSDFACIEEKLIVELDGGQHADALVYDADRTRFLQSKGWRVLRFWNDALLLQTDAAREQILRALQKDGPHPGPLPRAGEGATHDTWKPQP